MASDVAERPAVSFDQLVPGRLVHRRHLADVLITDARALGDDVFACGVQWPQNHSLLGRDPRQDPMLVAETIRQATTYVAHTMYEVPLGYQFLMARLEFESPDTKPVPPTSEAIVTLSMTDVHRNSTSLTTFVSRLVISDDNGEIARGAGHARLTSPQTYARTRALALAHDSDQPAETTRGRLGRKVVGVSRVEFSLLAPTGLTGEFRLIVDPTNPAFFDHTLDHVPGMLLIEAAQQAVRSFIGVPNARLCAIDFKFSRMIELRSPCFLTVRSHAAQADNYEVIMHQDGHVAGVAACQTIA